MRCIAVLFLAFGTWVGLAGSAAGQAVEVGQAVQTVESEASEGELARAGLHRDTLDAQRIQPFVVRPFVIAGTERVWLDGVRLDTSRYRIDHRHGRLWMEAVPPEAVRLVVAYRTFPFAFESVYRRRRVAATDTAGLRRVVEEADAGTAYDPFAGLTLERSGSITRGIVAGSGRDVGIESGLRLQLAGELAEDVHVRAALTDENTPIQPEGTTQRLRDFDRVFVEIDGPYGTAQLGDVDLDLDGSVLGRVDRKLQGAKLVTAAGRPPARWWDGARATAAGAVARGTYRRQEVEALEGVQGPYRLRGAQGEPFVPVVAGSERVYLDGELLTRGESNDYVIDYATGELTFTTNRLITAERRIRVEFEYAASPYTRTFAAAQARTAFGAMRGGGERRVRLGATVIREADSRQFDAAAVLTAQDSLALVEAGDRQAYRSGVERVPFDAEARYVQYTREERTRPDGEVVDIYVAVREAPPEGAPVYRVRFSRVAGGGGSYERVGRSLNGVVYVYRGPGEGDYEPVVPLPRPTQQRLVGVQGAVTVLPGVEAYGEWAGSLDDRNRLSALDASDDRGTGYVAGARLRRRALDLGPWSLPDVEAAYRRQRESAHFAAFARTRPVEFERRWNMESFDDGSGGIVLARDRVTDVLSGRVTLADSVTVGGEVGRLDRGDTFASRRRVFTLASGRQGLPRLAARRTVIESADGPLAVEGRWLRQRAAVRQPFWDGRLEPRLEVEQQDRRQRAGATDSLVAGSFAFVEYRPGVAYRQGALQVDTELEWRAEEEAAEGGLRPASTAWTLQSTARYRAGSAFDANARLGWRRRTFSHYFRQERGRRGRESVVLRSQTRVRPWERAVELEGFYEALTERTPTLQEVYVRAGPELGQYVWEDANGDGVLQVDEFLPERTPNEGTYVQTFVPSDSLVGVVGVQARLRLRLDPRRLWQGAGARWQRWLAHVQTQTQVEVREKSRAEDLAGIYLLDLSRFRDPATTQSGQLRLAQDVALFRTEPGYGLDLSYSRVSGLENRAAGAEERFLRTWLVEGEVVPTAAWRLALTGAWRTNRAASRFDSRTYAIRSVEAAPAATYTAPGGRLELTARAVLASKRDAVGARRALLARLPTELRYARAGRFQLTLRGEAAYVDLEGAAAGLARFELTDGRGPGTSYLWGASGQYAVTGSVRAALAYDGRAPAEAPFVNTLRVSLNASF